MGTLYDINRKMSSLLDLAEAVDTGISPEYIAALQADCPEMARLLSNDNGRWVLDVPAWQDAVAETMDDADAKVEAIAHVITDTKHTVELIKAERQRLAKRQSASEHLIERLEAMIECAIGHSKWQSKVSPLKLSYRRTEYVDIYDDAALPDDVLVTKVETTPSKTLIKDRIKSGEEVPGARMGERWGLQIR